MELTDFMDMEHLQQLQDNFSAATGLAAVAIDTEGRFITRGSGFNDFCMQHTRGCSEGARRCQKCEADGKGAYECHAGLLAFSVHIMLNGQRLGSMVGGQALSAPLDEKRIEELAKELGLDPKLYVRAANKLPIRSEETVRAAAALLEDAVNQIVLQEYMNGTEYKKLQVWEKEISNATKTVARIKENTRQLESIASKQTIMALNASIETARVGAAGAGFGVIAKQMGAFSKQSTEIYKKITEDANIISESIHKMNNI